MKNSRVVVNPKSSFNTPPKEVEPFHFFASSVATWVTTTDKRTLPDVIELMEDEGYIYSLFLVPGSWESDYQIRHYAPQVDGAVILGTFTPKKHVARKSA